MIRIVTLVPETHHKAWGKEIWYVNNNKYCFKKLYFDKGKAFSMHFHDLKEETWLVESGRLELTLIETDTAERFSTILETGDTIHIPRLAPHKLTALEDSVVSEVSTPHFESDSYRVEPGDSQKTPLPKI